MGAGVNMCSLRSAYDQLPDAERTEVMNLLEQVLRWRGTAGLQDMSVMIRIEAIASVFVRNRNGEVLQYT